MKITAQEEYGLRILLRIAFDGKTDGLTIPQISEVEGLSQHYVAKLCRILRLAGFLNSSRGKEGGYSLAIPPEQINVNQVLVALGGKLYTPGFCGSHSGNLNCCTHSVDCSVRSLWQIIQQTVDQVLDNFTLNDLIGSEEQFRNGYLEG